MKKNIAFVIYSLNAGGAERVVSTLSNSLCETYNVAIISLIDSKPFYTIDKKVSIITCFKEIKPSSNFIESIITNYKLYSYIKKYSKDYNIDLLIGFMTATNILATFAAKSIGIPIIISERNYPVLMKISMFWKLLRRFSYPKADKLVVQTKPIAEYFNSYVKRKRITILPNPISSHFKVDRETLQVERKNIVLNVGSLTYQKGQDILIKAFARIKPENWELHIIGEGPKRKEYEVLIEELGMKKSIKLLGRNNQISFSYLSSKIFVFPSRYEGFPNALTEAMYMGLPCISTDCPTGPSELIEHMENGILFPVDDVNQLEYELDCLIKNQNLRKEMGEKATLSVLNLNENNVTEKWSKLIDEFLV